jgi:hypothetical protein
MKQSEKIDKINKLADAITPLPDHWIGNHPNGDNGEGHCKSCCETHVKTLNDGFYPPTIGEKSNELTPLKDIDKQAVEDYPPFIDGGWGSEHDNSPKCSTCYKPLTGTLTDSGASEEISHFLYVEEDSILIDTPTKAWEISLIINEYSEKNKSNVDKIIKKITFTDD